MTDETKKEYLCAEEKADLENMFKDLENISCRMESCAHVASLLHKNAEVWFGLEQEDIYKLGGLGIIAMLDTQITDITIEIVEIIGDFDRMKKALSTDVEEE
jgi:hypothetical protein